MAGSREHAGDPWDEVLARSGEAGALIAGLDWSSTPLGPVEHWSVPLRTSVYVCLASRFPALVWWGPELVMVYNDAFRPILGSSKHPRAMGSPGQAVWPEIWDVIGPTLDGMLDGAGAVLSEDRYMLIDRYDYLEECYFTFSYSPIAEATGNVGGIFCIVAETTGRVAASRRLRMLAELATVLTAVATVDEVGAAAMKVLATAPDDVAVAELRVVEADGLRLAARTGPDAQLDVAALETVAATGDAAVVPAGRAPAGGALAVPICEPGREAPSGALVMGLSIRHQLDDAYRSFVDLVAGHLGTAMARVRARESERRRVEVMAQLDAAKTAFFANVSHELRTPLSLVAGPVQDLLVDRDAPLSAHQRERLELVQRNAGRLRRLVEDVLDVSRIEAGWLEPERTAVALAQLSAEVATAFAPAVERAGLELVVDAPPLPRTVSIDRDMWERIVLNLLSNAVKFTDRGTITLRVTDGGDHAEVQVSDTGEGIPADELPRIFERFHRVRSAAGGSRGGTGIGLALVHELVALHDGTVTVDSAPGAGTTFTVTLPYGRGVVADAAPAGGANALLYADETLGRGDRGRRPAGLTRVGSSAPDVDGAARVLVADDDGDLRRYLTELLVPHYRVDAVADGAEALERVRRDRPDLVLTDVMMPGLDGIALLRAVRADPAVGATPVVLLSARAREDAAVEAFDAGADDYLVKPFSPPELLARVRSTLELAGARSREAGWRTAIVRSMREGVFVADADGVVFEVNDAWADMVGYGQDEAPYRPPCPWWPDPEDEPEALTASAAAETELRAQGGGTVELPLRHRDGHRVWVSVAVSQVRDPLSGERLAVGAARDVTRERDASARREAVARLTARLASAGTDADVCAGLCDAVGGLFGGTAHVALWERERITLHGPAGPVPPEDTDGALLDVLRGVRDADGLTSEAGVGAVLDGERDGAIWVAFHRPREPSPDDSVMLGVVAGLATQALRRTRRYELEHLVARTLQHSMLGPADRGGDLYARYEPSAPELEVGGDWYDRVLLPGGRVGLVVGDCVGQGLDAAAVMGQLRSAARALLLADLGPGAVLDRMDRVAQRVEGAMCTTVLCAIADPAEAELTYSVAGHPPAVVVRRNGRAEWLGGARSIPLATAPVDARPEASVALRPGELVLAYTDGLVERRDVGLDARLELLRRTVEESAHVAPAALVDHVIERLAPPGSREDDVAVLAYRVGG